MISNAKPMNAGIPVPLFYVETGLLVKQKLIRLYVIALPECKEIL
jgi:hypothetical protein